MISGYFIFFPMEDLSAALKKSLSGAVQELLLALMMTPARFDAHRLRQSMEVSVPASYKESFLKKSADRSRSQILHFVYKILAGSWDRRGSSSGGFVHQITRPTP